MRALFPALPMSPPTSLSSTMHSATVSGGLMDGPGQTYKDDDKEYARFCRMLSRSLMKTQILSGPTFSLRM